MFSKTTLGVFAIAMLLSLASCKEEQQATGENKAGEAAPAAEAAKEAAPAATEAAPAAGGEAAPAAEKAAE